MAKCDRHFKVSNPEMFLLVVGGKSKWIELFPVLVTTVYATILAVHFFLDIGLHFLAQEAKDFP